MLCDQEVDLRVGLVAAYYRSKSHEEAKDAISKLEQLIKGFEDWLAKDKGRLGVVH